MKIVQYKDKNNKTRYQVKGYIGTDILTGKKKIITRNGFVSKKEAELTFNRIKLDFEKNGNQLNSKRMKFKEVCELWLKLYEPTVKPTTFFSQKQVINNHVLPYYGEMYVDKISILICQKFVDQQAKKLVRYHNSCNLAYRILEYAVHLRLISDNPATHLIRPKSKKSEYSVEWWTKEELNTFIECLHSSDLDSNAKTMLHLLAFTGMRKGEAMGLFWSDIDFQKGTITINKTAGETINGYTVQLDEGSKTIAGNRVISIDNRTLQLLKKHKLNQTEMLFKLGKHTKNTNQLVFCNERNMPLYGEFPNHNMKKVIEGNNLKFITTHQLRHTHCSILFEAGATMKEVQERLGHKDYKTTHDIYLKVSERQKEETANKFVEFLSI
ncbi:site-specific integrase [Tuanshanicoccus lijuaniae]|uniref:tyrosine-type recombinase/integrase n=1 Tax=Aerococcaceae bacterium zg-1292 TaxID=2774330 RepID=UPI00193854C5|nr:site-specific integrase [Aerococcaceae bacterium zg-1292]MBS4456996.1 site-specific integrase [Aerococcaceae bacterium zg-A91]MBS4458739.1 site-specific integrase [Aerococcaceae bacterium zg-BR33]QQA37519.1 site-specific integrase [Aerococcaceae bacterium zg-1292]